VNGNMHFRERSGSERRHQKRPEERAVIIATLQGVLEAQPDIPFAYLSGSFFRDFFVSFVSFGVVVSQVYT
jgi:hypothetical protein